jgi:hypothetical protein
LTTPLVSGSLNNSGPTFTPCEQPAIPQMTQNSKRLVKYRFILHRLFNNDLKINNTAHLISVDPKECPDRAISDNVLGIH